MIHLGDITKLHGGRIPVVDVITGGSPCQDLSVAGHRAGLSGERSGLFMEQIRIVKEMRENDRANGRTAYNIRPRYMVWENVPGALSSLGKRNGEDHRGEDFQAVLTEIARIVKEDVCDVPLPADRRWPNAGCIMGYGEDGCPFSIAWRVHDAQFWGVPQRRRRIALVADFGGLSAPEICFERKGLCGDTTQSQGERKRTSGSTEGSVGEAGSICLNDQGGERMGVTNDITATLRAQDHGHPPAAFGIDRATYNMGRNAKFGISVREELEPTIVAKGPGAVAQPVYSSSKASFFTAAEEDMANTLVATDYKDPPIVNDVAYGFYHQMKAEGMGVTEEVSGTLINGTNPGYQNGVVSPEYIVRRLTPTECERLQGYPDGWTDIGEWTDSKGKVHKESSDASRYKALGNSIACPYWYVLLRRISAQYERPATLGSLFDGIGGFPLCWERCNGKGTALWASEIDEFPIAVTKRRFGNE